ncbi:medium-chain acyl-CoA ligase ACSF2, mitochondrial-like [Euwallacea similis]|uniref:medium-chain acyl-CoA ligase ACSF2, mitochondrial-like n=1 Tax=Euwallacea similis TaxID=1736056 RepID=UPI00344E5425
MWFILKRKLYHRMVFQQARLYTNRSYIHYPGKDLLRSLTVGKLLEQAAETYKNRPALISKSQNQTLTFQEVLIQADKLAAGFRSVGLHPGDRIGIWAPNLIEWYITDMACARGGYILVNFNPAFQPKEIRPLINSVQLSAIVCPHKFKSQDYYKHLVEICPELPDCPRGKLQSKATPTLKSVIITSEENLKGAFQYNEIASLASQSEINKIQEYQQFIDPDQVCHMQFTSGTTGIPKAPVQSHFQRVNNSYFVGKRNELDIKHHVICVQVPFFHVFGTVATIGGSLNFGTTLVLPASSFNPDKSLDAIRDEKCSIIYGTPTMYVDVINRQKMRNENINPEIAVSGGAPCSPHLFHQMKRVLKLKKVKSIYGLSETTCVIFQSMSDDDEYHSTATVGHIGDHLEAKVVDAEGKIVPKGTPGELLIRGYLTTLGYYNNEEKTKELMGPDGWLHTGDQFVLEDNGYGKIVGRLKDVIIRGGENIFPKEIEDILNTHPNILESQVVGVPHERLGEEVCAVLRVKDKHSMNLHDIVSYCKGKIAQFKIPSRLEIVDMFPKTASGKVQKFKIVHHLKNNNK